MIKRISRLYLLHVVCTFLMLPLCFLGPHSENVIFVIFKLLLNLLMIQEWFPFAYNSINDVSWFLCSICFGYFMFPWFCRRLENRNKSADGVLKIIVGLLVFQVATSFLINLLFGGMHFDGIFVDNPVYWFLYNYPLMRFVEIAIGYFLGYYYLYSRKEIDTKICSFMEILMLIIVLGNGIFLNWYFTWSFEETWWWTCAVVYTFQVCVTVYVFALGRGIISRIMCNPLTKLVSSIGSDAFLIHYVVFDYLTTIVYLLSGREFEIVFGPLINLTLGVVLTISGCLIWRCLCKKLVKV